MIPVLVDIIDEGFVPRRSTPEPKDVVIDPIHRSLDVLTLKRGMQIHVFIGLDLKHRYLHTQESFDRVELTLEYIRSSVAIQVLQEMFMDLQLLK